MTQSTLPANAPEKLAKRRLGVLIPALCLPFFASLFYFVIFPGTTFGNSFYVAIKIFLLVWPLVATLAILRQPFSFRLPSTFTRQPQSRSWPMGIIFGVATCAVLFGLLEIPFFANLIEASYPNIAEKCAGMGVADHFIWFALFVSILHAGLEEYYWRGFVFGQLRRICSMPTAIIIAALGFTSHHVVILSQFFPLGWAFAFGACVGIGGAVWSLLYWQSGRLWGAWISHMIVDFGLMYIGWKAINYVG